MSHFNVSILAQVAHHEGILDDLHGFVRGARHKDGGHDVDEGEDEVGREADEEERVVQERDGIRVEVQHANLAVTLSKKDGDVRVVKRLLL